MPYLHADKDKRFKRGAENTSGLCRVLRLLECRIKPVPFRECARDGNFFCRPGGFFQAGGGNKRCVEPGWRGWTQESSVPRGHAYSKAKGSSWKAAGASGGGRDGR